jgi:TonB-linked SusC/RagA family outer membrane protein
MKIKTLLITSVVILTSTVIANGQNSLVGVVIDSETQETLPGVNVFISSLEIGTATDADGEFELTNIIDGTYEVQFSSIGYRTLTRTVTIDQPETVLNAELAPDIGLLDEVVVSGVADATPKRLLSVSVSRIDAQTINRVPATSVSNSLTGKVSGVTIRNTSGTPGGDSNIQLRADNNLNLSSSPLLIVDGVIIEGSLSDINADDIENIEVVKGAAASSLYGSRAGNGVVVVTTKRGDNIEAGDYDITVRNEYGIQQIANTINLSEAHYFDLASDWENHSNYTKFAGVTYPSNYVGGFSGGVSGTRQISADRYMDNPFAINQDIQNEFFTNGSNLTNFVSVATRLNELNIYTSFENNTQTGIIPDTDGFNRRNFRINADYDIADWIKLSTSNLFINTTSEFPGSGGGIFFDLVLAEPDNNLFLDNPDGQPYYIRHNQWSNEVNPLYNVWKEDRDETTRRQITNYTLSLNPIENLSLNTSYSVENESYFYTSYTPFDTWDIGTSGPGAVSSLGISYNQGDLYKYFEDTRSLTLSQQATFRQSFNKLRVVATAKYQYEQFDFEYFDSYGFDFGYVQTPTLNAFSSENISSSSQQTEIVSENIYGSVFLAYDDTYILDGLLRRDESSLFGPESRTNLYYRASAAVIVSELIDIPAVEFLKIRASQGTSGNRPAFSWQYETFSLSGGSASKSTLGNKDLKPSTITETEIGIEANFNRVTTEFIYSQATTKDQFLRVPLLPLSGFNGQYQNAGTVESNTVEFNTNAQIIRTNDMSWDLRVTWQSSEQEITKLDVPPYFSGPDGLYYIAEGETYGAIYGRSFVTSLDQLSNQLTADESIDDYKVNSDGYVVPKGSQGTDEEAAIYVLDEFGSIANTKIGDGRPDWTAGISNTFSYKNLSVYALVDIKHGGDVYNRKSQWLTRDSRNGIMDMTGVPESEKKTFDYFQSFYDVNSNNAYWVEDGGFVKLREVAISYNLTSEQLQPIFGNVVNDVKVSVFGRNLYTWTKYSGYDPEVGSIRNPYDGTGAYPNFRNISASIQFKF